jgi:hypothetical protein
MKVKYGELKVACKFGGRLEVFVDIEIFSKFEDGIL